MNTYICEVCDKTETLTADAAYSAGWDYPPFMGAFGIVGPRTCPDCPMTATVWWTLTEANSNGERLQLPDLSARHRAAIARILSETAAAEGVKS